MRIIIENDLPRCLPDIVVISSGSVVVSFVAAVSMPASLSLLELVLSLSELPPNCFRCSLLESLLPPWPLSLLSELSPSGFHSSLLEPPLLPWPLSPLSELSPCLSLLSLLESLFLPWPLSSLPELSPSGFHFSLLESLLPPWPLSSLPELSPSCFHSSLLDPPLLPWPLQPLPELSSLSFSWRHFHIGLSLRLQTPLSLDSLLSPVSLLSESLIMADEPSELELPAIHLNLPLPFLASASASCQRWRWFTTGWHLYMYPSVPVHRYNVTHSK